MSKPKYLPAGNKVICCKHVAMNGRNQQITIVDFNGPEYDHVRRGVEKAEQADWLMLCQLCRKDPNQENGAPYNMIMLTREVSLPG